MDDEQLSLVGGIRQVAHIDADLQFCFIQD